MSQYRVAIVGATGAVGTEMRRLLRDRAYPASEIVPFASERSAGKVLDDGLTVQGLADDERLDGFDVAIFSAGGSISREWAPRFAARGAIVVDNSSAFRMDPDVPLVVSEVNPEALDHINKGIVANPNCTTMAIMPPLHALHVEFGLTAIVATSFQAAGGAGQKGMDELIAQVPGLLADPYALQTDGASAAAKVGETPVFGKPLAFNVVPLLGSDTGNGYTDEEMKLQNESRKILGIAELAVSPTCVRVPVMVGHAVEVRAQFEREPSVARALEVMGAHDGRGARRRPDAAGVGGQGSRGRRSRPPGPQRPIRVEPVHRRRQPAQGRGAEHGADCRAAARARDTDPPTPARGGSARVPPQRQQADVIGRLPAGERGVGHRVGQRGRRLVAVRVELGQDEVQPFLQRPVDALEEPVGEEHDRRARRQRHRRLGSG